MRLSAHGDNGGIAAPHLGSRTATPVTIDPDAQSILSVGPLCPSTRRDRSSSSSSRVAAIVLLYTCATCGCRASNRASQPASQGAVLHGGPDTGISRVYGVRLASLREMSPIFRITSSDIPLRFSLSAMDYFARLLLSPVLSIAGSRARTLTFDKEVLASRKISLRYGISSVAFSSHPISLFLSLVRASPFLSRVSRISERDMKIFSCSTLFCNNQRYRLVKEVE